jgi:hypothetical protein
MNRIPGLEHFDSVIKPGDGSFSIAANRTLDMNIHDYSHPVLF